MTVDFELVSLEVEIKNHLFDVEERIGFTLNSRQVAEFISSFGVFSVSSADEIISYVARGDFNGEKEKIFDTVVLSESIIPQDVTVSLIKDYKVNGQVWRIHKNDADPFPSSPHAHNLENHLKMHLGNGCLYRKRQYIGKKVDRKHLVELREKVKKVALPPLEDP